MLDKNTWNHLTVLQKKKSLFKISINKMYLQIIYSIYMYKKDLALHNVAEIMENGIQLFFRIRTFY